MMTPTIYTHRDAHGDGPEVVEREHSGQQCEVVRPLTADEADLHEVGPMYHVRFTDGVEIDAFADELEHRAAA